MNVNTSTGPFEVITIGLGPDEKLLESITQAVKDYDIKHGSVISGARACTHCPIAANYLSIDEPVFGRLLHCISDPFICKGFNPRIKHHKTKSLMNGDDCCDHTYIIESQKKGGL